MNSGEELSAPCPIQPEHERAGFSCGEEALDEWLRRRALKNETAGASRTYVLLAGDEAIAYYSLAAGGVARRFSPGTVRRDMPDPIPVMILARLAVDTRRQGRGIGRALVRDALLRTMNAAHIAGIRALLVHALNQRAASFYQNLGFLPSPFDPLVLLLPLRHFDPLDLAGEKHE